MTLLEPPADDLLVAHRRTRVPLDWLGWTGVGIISLATLAALFAPVVAPHDPNSIDLSAVLSGPAANHLLGTDYAGRDILSRTIFGARASLLAPLGIIVLSLALGVPLGMISARRQGITDAAISRGADILLAFPSLLFAILAVALFGASLSTAVIALAVAYTPSVFRLTRGLTLSEREREYVSAYQVAGFDTPTIYLRHILPNIGAIVLAHSIIQFGYALIDVAVLSFLGFGVQPPTSDWGTMIQDGQSYLLQGAPWESLSAGMAIVLVVVAFNFAGQRLADVFGGDR